ncbi:MAG: cation:dicarboxylate symporter family transporter, partial [Planctomycetota bacterium]
MGLSGQILAGILLGLACGLFFGPLCAPLRVVGDAFIGLLQMTVLPYIVVALVANIGRLSWAQGKRLFARGSVVLLLLWGVGLLAVALTALAFPARDTASFFSITTLAKPPPPDFVRLFIPFNVFQSLVQDVVPAVVLFSIFLGAALMGVERKDRVLDILDVSADALMRVNLFVVKLTPIGVFAMMAAAAGTMTLEEFGRIQGYLVAYTLMVAILTFWVLPSLIAALTPFTYREVFHASKSALLTAFATGKVLIVLPMLIEETKKLFEAKTPPGQDTGGTIDVLYPLAYPFPHLGKLMGLLFIPFAGWFLGTPLVLGQYPVFLGAGLVSYFGGGVVATPFLLDLMRLPSDMMQLFLISGIWAARFGDLLGAMHLMALTILTTTWLGGMLRVRWRAVLRSLAVTAGLAFLALAGTRLWLAQAAGDTYRKADVLAALNSFTPQAPFEVLDAVKPHPVMLAPGESRIDRAKKTGVLRVGVDPRRRPYAFRNPRGDLVGFDVEMALDLAHDTGLRIEFMTLALEDLPEALARDEIDVALSGLVATLGRASVMAISRPYAEAHPAVLVPDAAAGAFASLEALRARKSLALAVADPTFAEPLERALPRARVVAVGSVGEAVEALEGGRLAVDAIVTSAEVGSAWTLVHPAYSVVVPDGVRGARPVVMGLPRGDEALRKLLDLWIELKQ